MSSDTDILRRPSSSISVNRRKFHQSLPGHVTSSVSQPDLLKRSPSTISERRTELYQIKGPHHSISRTIDEDIMEESKQTWFSSKDLQHMFGSEGSSFYLRIATMCKSNHCFCSYCSPVSPSTKQKCATSLND